MQAWLRTLSILTAVAGFMAPCLLCCNHAAYAEEAPTFSSPAPATSPSTPPASAAPDPKTTPTHMQNGEEVYTPKTPATPTVEHHDGGGDPSKPIATPASPDTQAETTNAKPNVDFNNGPVWFGGVAAVLCVVMFLLV